MPLGGLGPRATAHLEGNAPNPDRGSHPPPLAVPNRPGLSPGSRWRSRRARAWSSRGMGAGCCQASFWLEGTRPEQGEREKMRGAGAVSRCLSHPKRKARRVREPVRRSGLGIAGLRGPGPAASQLLGFVVRDRGRSGAAAAAGSRAGPKQPAGSAPGARGSAAAGRAPTRPRRPQRKGVWESARGGGGSLSPSWVCLEPRAPQTRLPPAPPPGVPLPAPGKTVPGSPYRPEGFSRLWFLLG
ncbi:translation initiation factor IF-2-like [Cervus elaphus]|uniref:translation initiation factor IF-2-like n=1 Tax=Cervus elaphus TaxID=9860 RepID=UPI001CC2950C|nr:translation initiation factor IF-2-like [Cervus elaphus]